MTRQHETPQRRTNQASSSTVVSVGLMAVLMGLATMSAQGQERLTGSVKLDGSSTVAPITMAAAEMFMEHHPRVRVTVGISGTGGGFNKFLDEKPSLRTDISDASRTIKGKELERAEKLGIEFIEIPIGIDGIVVMVHPSNTFCKHLSVAELKRIWEPGSGITNWSQIRKGLPDVPLKLYGPGTDSGTFDYFTKAICGKEKASRSDYTASESDNVLVRGIAGNRGSLGYFGYSYYEANRDKLRLVAIDNNNGTPVEPSLDVIRGGTYKPLSRPMFLYVNKAAYRRPEVKAFLGFFFDNARTIVEHPRVNYVALSDELYGIGRQRLDTGRTGSAMASAGEKSANMADVFTKD